MRWARKWSAQAKPGRKPRDPLREREDRRRWIRLTCPFTEPWSDPRLVTQTPDPKSHEERARDAQGQVGHGARAHPVQETGGRESALHGFQPGLTTFVNEKKSNEWILEEEPAVTVRTTLIGAAPVPLLAETPPRTPYPCRHW